MNDVGWELFQVRRLTRRLREFLEDCDSSSLDLDGEILLFGDPPLFESFCETVVEILGLTHELKKARIGCPDKLDLIRKTCLSQLGPPIEVEQFGGTQALRISDLMTLRAIVDEFDRVAETGVSSEVRDSVKATEETIVQCGRRLHFSIERTRFALEFFLGRDLTALSQRDLIKQAITYLSLNHDISMIDRLERTGFPELSERVLSDYRRKMSGDVGSPTEPIAAAQNAPSKGRGKRRKSGNQSQPDSALLLDSLLVQHHGYGDPNGELSDEPVKASQLVALSGYAKATVSDYFRDRFGSYQGYKLACNDSVTLENCLKLANGDVKPKHFLTLNERQFAADDE